MIPLLAPGSRESVLACKPSHWHLVLYLQDFFSQKQLLERRMMFITVRMNAHPARRVGGVM